MVTVELPAYPGYAFRQNEAAPLQVTFVAPSCEIDQWAKVPTRLASAPRGFQRAAIPGHVSEIRKFFVSDQTKRNASPTSILLGIQPDQKSRVRLLDGSGTHIAPSTIGQTAVPCTVVFDFLPWSPGDYSSPSEELMALVASVLPHLQEAVEAEAVGDADSEAVDDEEFDDEAVDDDTDADGTQDDNDIGMGDSAEVEERRLRLLPTHSLVAQLQAVDLDEWSDQKQEALRRILVDERKPGLIIDGQHRVAATRGLPDVPFIVSLLPDADWAELAFQFIVNNHSARKVDDNLLFAIVGQSLAPLELQTIEARLNASGIRVSLIQASMKVQLEDNPFASMLKTNTPGEPGFLDATAMQKKVIAQWYGGRGRNGLTPRLKNLQAIRPETRTYRMIDLFGANCNSSTALDRAEEWQDGLWFEYFREFWTAVRTRYVGDRLWPATQDDWPTPTISSLNANQTKVQRLMGATILGLLQISVLQQWADTREKAMKYSDKDYKLEPLSPLQFGAEISKIIDPLSPDFFTQYKSSGPDASKEVRTQFIKAILEVLDTKKTVADAIKAYPHMFKA